MDLLGGGQFLEPREVIETARIMEGQSVAHLGCGSGGFFTVPIGYKVGPTGRVFAVDAMSSAIEATKKAAQAENLKSIEFILGNLEAKNGSKISDSSVEAALLVSVLFQNNNKEAIIGEASRVLKKGGRLLIVDWIPGITGIGPAENLKISPESVKMMLPKNGLDLIEDGELSPYHYYLLARKK